MQAGGHEFESHHLHESNEESVRVVRTKPSDRACVNELGIGRTDGYSKNTRDEQMVTFANPVHESGSADPADNS